MLEKGDVSTEWQGRVTVECPESGPRNRVMREAFPRASSHIPQERRLLPRAVMREEVREAQG